MNRSYLRIAAGLGAVSLTAVAMAPALAAGNIAVAGANALTLSIAGNGNGTGTVTATHDGTTETVNGAASPPISVLKNQKLLNVGVLAQEATAKKQNNSGYSAACAGVAGNGGSLAQIGDSGCLTPGDPVGLFVTNLDLTDAVVIDPNSAIGPLSPANEVFQPVLAALTKPLADGFADSPLAGTGLGGSFGAIESFCTAEKGSASGNANIVDTKLVLNVAGNEVVLANLPAHPAPNTDVLIDLDKATTAITDALQTQFKTMLSPPGGPEGPFAPFAALPEALQTQVINALVEATREQLLTPLSDNVLKIVLNKQIRTGPDSIKVRAVDLEVLPAAKEQFGAAPVAIQIANVACGPNDRVSGPPTPEPKPKPTKKPVVLPTNVPAGYAGDAGSGTGGEGPGNEIVLAAFAIMFVGGTALVGLRLRA